MTKTVRQTVLVRSSGNPDVLSSQWEGKLERFLATITAHINTEWIIVVLSFRGNAEGLFQ